MAMKAEIPFKQILTVVKSLSAAQKERLREELALKKKRSENPASFTTLLLRGPVYSRKQIGRIEENRKTLASWRTKK
jgi:hypothetical protein